jgi:hypothetical protein
MNTKTNKIQTLITSLVTDQPDPPSWFPQPCGVKDAITLYEDLYKWIKNYRKHDAETKKMIRQNPFLTRGHIIMRSILAIAHRTHEEQEHFIKSVMELQADGDWRKGECPCEIGATKYGKGIIATKDITAGDVIGIYPVDLYMPGSLYHKMVDSKPHFSADDGVAPTKAFPFMDQHVWGVFTANLGITNPHEPESDVFIRESIVDNGGILPQKLESYGYTCHGAKLPVDQQWRDNFDDYVTEGWAHPDIKHKNEWALIHMGNDGLFNKDTMESVEDYDEANMKHIDELEKNSDWHEEAVNTTLEFISVATRNIKKGEEICDTYGGEYWFNGKVNQHQMANLDRSNRGRVKKFKKKRKEFETFRKEAWYQMLDVTAKSYEEETMEQIQAELKDPEKKTKVFIAVKDGAIRLGSYNNQ